MLNKLSYILIFFALLSCKKDTKNKENTTEGTPKFGIQQEIHNFGELESGEVISFSFKISNTGTGILKIDSINSGCGCLCVDLDKKALNKNESTYLNVTFNSAGEWGNVYKPITIYTNTKKMESTIYIAAKVNNSLFN